MPMSCRLKANIQKLINEAIEEVRSDVSMYKCGVDEDERSGDYNRFIINDVKLKESQWQLDMLLNYKYAIDSVECENR
jgi:hypothetical protein